MPEEPLGRLAAAPYAYCDAHFIPNCPMCKEAQPNPVISGDPLGGDASVIGRPGATAVQAEPQAPPPPPKPIFTDPQAVAVLEASERFAKAREAVTLVEAQMARVAEALETIRQKHGEALAERGIAQKTLIELLEDKK